MDWKDVPDPAYGPDIPADLTYLSLLQALELGEDRGRLPKIKKILVGCQEELERAEEIWERFLERHRHDPVEIHVVEGWLDDAWGLWFEDDIVFYCPGA